MSRCYECAELDGYCTCRRDRTAHNAWIEQLSGQLRAAEIERDKAHATLGEVRALANEWEAWKPAALDPTEHPSIVQHALTVLGCRGDLLAVLGGGHDQSHLAP